MAGISSTRGIVLRIASMRRWCVKIVTKVGERCKGRLAGLRSRLGIWDMEMGMGRWWS
jgi:hypothetical protein